MFTPGKFGRGGGGRGQPGRMVPPPRGSGTGASAIAPMRSSRSGGMAMGIGMGRGVGPPRVGSKGIPNIPPPAQNGTEETLRLMPGSGPPPFAMVIRLIPGLVEEVKRVEAEGGRVQIKFGPTANNPPGNIIDVGGKEFKFTWAPEQGELCDIYEEQQSGEDGNGVLVESGSVWRKISVQRTLSEFERGQLKRRSVEAERQQKSRKAIILDHGNPVVKNQTKPVATASSDVNVRKLPVKIKKEPPPKKRKIETSSAAVSSKVANSKSATSPVAFPSEQQMAIAPPLTGQTSGSQLSRGHAITDETITCRPKLDVGKQREKASTLALTPVSEGRVQKAGVGSTPTDLRNLLITQLTENPKGMTIKAIEKAIGVIGKKIEPVIKTIANYQAPGKYILKLGLEKEGSMKLSPCSGSSTERQPSISPLVDMSPLSDKAAEPADEQQMHSTPKQDSDLNIVDEIDDHLHESPDVTASQKKVINSDGSGSSSSSDSGSDSESDSGSSDSGSDSDRSQSRSRSRSKSKSRSPAGSGSGSSSGSESEGTSGNSEEADVNITSDDDKSDNEAEAMKDLSDSKLTPSHADRDEFGESYKQKGTIEQKSNGQFPQSPRNSEEVDVCDDIGDGEEISKIAQHYIGKMTSDGEDDTDMALDIDVIHSEGEIKSPEGRITISPEHVKRGDNHSPISVRGSLRGTLEEERNASKENPIDKTFHKSEKTPKNVSKHGRDSNQSQIGSEKYSSRQDNRGRAEKIEEVDSDMRRNRDVILSQTLYDSPARAEITSNRKDLETRQVAKAINKARVTNATSERDFEHATPVGRSVRDEDTFKGKASTRAQIAFAKDLDDVESFDQHFDGQQSYLRPADSNSRAKVPDVLQGSGRYADSLNKAGKLNDRASRPGNESDISTAKSACIEDKNSRYEMTLRTAPDEDVVAKEKFNISSFSKESENIERYKPIDSQCKRTAEQSVRKDAGSLGLSVMRNTSKDTKNVEIEKRQLHSAKESALKREYSDLELGELREPVSEEEPQEPKSRFDKSQIYRSSMDAKVKSGSKRESESPDVAKGRAIGKSVSELKKLSPSEPVEEPSKHDGRSGKRMLEDGMSDLVKPLKKATFAQARQPHSDHTDVEPLSRQEMTETAAKVAATEITKTSPFRGPETQGSAGYRKTPTSSLQKSEYKGKVPDATACDNKDVQKTKGNINLVERCKENTRGENNSIRSKKKPAPTDEGQAFYAKYEKDKAELRGPIKNIEQFKEFSREFQEKYACYQLLNSTLESDKEDFQKLGKDLQSAKDKGDAQLFATISEQVKKAYSHCALRHKRMKKVFLVLHEELKNLKQRARDFDARYHYQIQGR